MNSVKAAHTILTPQPFLDLELTVTAKTETSVPWKGLCSYYICTQHLQAGPGKACSVSSSPHQPQSLPPKCTSFP